jgi:hypothetical protein
MSHLVLLRKRSDKIECKLTIFRYRVIYMTSAKLTNGFFYDNNNIQPKPTRACSLMELEGCGAVYWVFFQMPQQFFKLSSVVYESSST